MKLDCQVCGQDVFAKTVVHVHGTRRTVMAEGWCRQCGHGVRRREVFEAGKRVDADVVVLPPRKSGASELGCIWMVGMWALVMAGFLSAVWVLGWAGLLDWMVAR